LKDDPFEKTQRRRQDRRLRPAADRLYREIWGDGIGIVRLGDAAWPADWDVLDKALGIDTIIKFQNGLIGTVQEKFLSHSCAGYRSLTVAYRNQFTGTELSWFKLATQFFFVGYESGDKEGQFGLWALVNWPALLLATNAGLVAWRTNQSKTGYTASFRYCIIDEIPVHCIVASSLKREAGDER